MSPGNSTGGWSPPGDTVLADLVLRHWGVQGVLSPLPSYTDVNRRLRCAEGEFVLKVAAPQCSADLLDLENQAMLHLQRTGCRARTPRLQPTLDGASMVRLSLDDGRDAHLRLIEFIDGPLLAEVPVDLALARSIGQQVAWLGLGLSRFEHPAASVHKDWNLDFLPGLRGAIALIDDQTLRHLVRDAVNAFAARLPVWRKCLPRQVIHNDANDYNLIVDRKRNAVCAIIDFGDMCHGFRLADLAIACVYAIQGQIAPQPLLDEVVIGYASVCPLLDAEREALSSFLRARLCQSILMAARAHRADPDNDYILVSQRAVCALLHQLA